MKPRITAEMLNAGSQNTMVSHLGIEFTEVGQDVVKATMPVDRRTIQPLGLLHGGASAALAETLGSVAATLHVDPETQAVVGLEINANHVRPVREGVVFGAARPIHMGRKTQVWEIKIIDKDDKLVCISRLTVMVIDKQS